MRSMKQTKVEVNEVTRAAQMAKDGIVSSNVLGREEIHRIIDEVATFPYSNELEAIEYANPKICSNGSTFLYVLPLPKVRKVDYNYFIVKPSVQEGKFIYVQFNTLLVNERETNDITEPCMCINNNTVKKLPEDDCISTLIEGSEAKCPYRSCEEKLLNSLCRIPSSLPTLRVTSLNFFQEHMQCTLIMRKSQKECDLY